MRLFLNFLAALMVVAGIFLYNSMQHREQQQTVNSEARFGQLLLRANKAAAERLEKMVQQTQQNVQFALLRAKKSEFIDPSLLAAGMPRFIYTEEHKIRAPDFLVDNELLGSVKIALAGKKIFSLSSSSAKRLLFLAGKTNLDEKYIAVFEPDSFFSFLREADGITHWIALQNAEILYHPQMRFWGTDASNMKPLSEGLRALSEGDERAIVSSYLGFEGHQTFGAWGTLPQLGLLLGSEWPGFLVGEDRSFSSVQWGALFFLSLGFFLLGFLWRRSGQKKRPELFDSSRLDADALDYMEELRRSGEDALKLVAEKNQIIERLESTARRQLLLAKDHEWRVETLQSFLKIISEVQTGKQVSPLVANLLSERFAGFPVVYYRYSHASFSLVPEFSAGLSFLEESARLYLADARIFVGKNSFDLQISSSEAFQRWNAQRLRHMPLSKAEVHFLPVEQWGHYRACYLLLIDQNWMDPQTLAEQLQFLCDLVREASWLYDFAKPLLQSKDEKRRPLASTSDSARN